MRKNGFFWAAFVAVLLLLLVILIHTNREMDQDLGRHIKLGEIIWQTREVPKTNLFSYTNPDFPFLNHHWGSEVVFYLMANATGIIGTSYLKIIFFASGLFFIVLTARKVASWETTLVMSSFFIPLLIPRSLERPEMFGYFFFCFFLFLYIDCYKNPNAFLTPGVRRTGLWVIPLLAFLWVNVHISFAYGFLLLGLFIADAFIRGERGQAKMLGFIFVASTAASLINPHGVSGLLYPLNVFRNYGYSIQENQNLFFLGSATANIFLPYFWFLFWVLVASFGIYVVSLIKDERSSGRLKEDFLFIALAAIFTVLALSAYRNLPFFVFTGVLCGAYFLQKGLGGSFITKRGAVFFLITAGTAAVFIFLIGTNYLYRVFDLNKKFEMRAAESYKEGVDFFLAHDLEGPIFNNFDIGGYLDYRLYPKHKVFVDNRPEAYPVTFFEEYKKAQADLEATQELFKKYTIQTIVFSHTDGTPWGMQFIKNLPKLTDFKIIYLDPALVIAVKKDHTLGAQTETDFEKLIAGEKEYRRLMTIFYLFNSWGKRELATRAFEKAYEANPLSCSTRLQYGMSLLRSPHLPVSRRGVEILRKTGVCPYPRYIKEELKTL